MAEELIPIDQTTAIAERERRLEEARDYISQAHSQNTRDAYASDLLDFATWCEKQSFTAMPALAGTVVEYLTERARTHKTSSLQRRLAAISQAHQVAGLEDPTDSIEVRKCWRGIRRAKGVAQEGKDPVLTEMIRQMVDKLPTTLLGARDRALLLLGFLGAFRRSELVSLNVEDLQFTPSGMVVILRRSKTDQEGEGMKKAIPHGAFPETCAVRAVQHWLGEAEISTGAIFRKVDRHGNVSDKRLTDQVVALVVKKSAEAIGLDPSRFSGHSLRAGLATSAAMAGVSERAIQNQTGHRSTVMLRKYIRDGNLFNDNAAGKLGL